MELSDPGPIMERMNGAGGGIGGSGGSPGPGTVYRWGVAATLGVVTVLVALLAVWTVRDILVLALVALFVAVSLDPATRWLVRHRVRRPFAVSIILLVAVLIVAA